jgi:hypothetical protein
MQLPARCDTVTTVREPVPRGEKLQVATTLVRQRRDRWPDRPVCFSTTALHHDSTRVCEVEDRPLSSGCWQRASRWQSAPPPQPGERSAPDGSSRPLACPGTRGFLNATILVAELRRKLSLIDGLPDDRSRLTLQYLTGGVFPSHPFVSALQCSADDMPGHGWPRIPPPVT